MLYSREEIEYKGLYRLELYQLSDALEAFNGFAGMFGKAWVDHYFPPNAQDTGGVRFLTSMWKDWQAVKPLNGSENLRARWQLGFLEEGVQTEIHTIGSFVRQGAHVELAPQISSGKRPDFRFRNTLGWVYVEITERKRSEVLRRASETLLRVAEAASRAIPGRHGKVAILRWPQGNDLKKILSWLGSGLPNEGARLDNLAVYYADSNGSPCNLRNDVANLVEEPRISTSHATSTGLQGSAFLTVADEAAQQIVEKKASQLPDDDPGIIVLDTTCVCGDVLEWQRLIERGFQPDLYAKVSAVVLFQTRISSQGPESKSVFAVNGFAKNSVEASSLQFARNAVISWAV